jgi:hypothetical protein
MAGSFLHLSFLLSASFVGRCGEDSDAGDSMKASINFTRMAPEALPVSNVCLRAFVNLLHQLLICVGLPRRG